MAADTPGPGLSELSKRILTGVVMAVVAIGVAVIGGWPFALFWGLAGAVIGWEWQRIVHGPDATFALAAGVGAGIMAAFAAYLASLPLLLLTLAFAVPAYLVSEPSRRYDTVVGIAYAALPTMAVIACRGDTVSGLIVICWLFAVVWGTDTLAYFTGRTFGGPKLWPRISPKKTWSGAIGGLVGGVLLGAGVLIAFGTAVKWQHVALSIVFSVATQLGDLFESSIKRKYDVKDSSHIIPGHGGVMDRLDGFVFAAMAAAAVGLFRSGAGSVPRGLLVW